VPITLVVLAAVFAAQRFGTEKVGKVFGPVMTIWFLSLAAIGIWNVVLSLFGGDESDVIVHLFSNQFKTH
jgi:K+ transporter